MNKITQNIISQQIDKLLKECGITEQDLIIKYSAGGEAYTGQHIMGTWWKQDEADFRRNFIIKMAEYGYPTTQSHIFGKIFNTIF